MGDRLIFGLEVSIISFAVVIVTLYLLYLILLGFSQCLAGFLKISSQKRGSGLSKLAAIEEAAVPVSAKPAEIVVAITAAATCCLDEPGLDMTVRPADIHYTGKSISASEFFNMKRLMEKRRDLAWFRRERRK